jgi:hypothetical protein
VRSSLVVRVAILALLGLAIGVGLARSSTGFATDRADPGDDPDVRG